MTHGNGSGVDRGGVLGAPELELEQTRLARAVRSRRRRSAGGARAEGVSSTSSSSSSSMESDTSSSSRSSGTDSNASEQRGEEGTTMQAYDPSIARSSTDLPPARTNVAVVRKRKEKKSKNTDNETRN